MAVELATAYISLLPSTSKIAPGVKDALSQAEKPAQTSGKNIGQSLVGGLNKVMKVGALAVGGAAAAGIGLALTKGFSRLNAIDQAKAKLLGLGNSTKTVNKIMDNALASVKGTAFGLDEAATVAASAVASGIKPGTQLTGVLKTIADTATIAGASMSDTGAIFGSVAARGKLQGDDMMQLTSRGVPVLQFLAKHYGITAQAASQMVTKGEVDFKNFNSAMQENLGGAALKSGSTFKGALDNVMASLGRIGANLLSGVFPQAKSGLNGLIKAMAPLEDQAKSVGVAIGGMIGWFKNNPGVLTGAAVAIGSIAAATAVWKVGVLAVTFAVNAWKTAILIWTGVQKAATAAMWLFDAAVNANPIVLIVSAIALLVAGLVWFFTQTKLGQQIWAGFTSFLATAWNWLWTSVLQPVFNAIGAAINFVASVVTWWWQNITVPAINGIVAVFQFMWALVKPIFDVFWSQVKIVGAVVAWLWNNAVVPAGKGIGAVFSWLWTSVLQPVFGWIGAQTKVVGSVFSWLYANVVKPVFNAIGSVFSWWWNSIVSPIAKFVIGAARNIGSVMGKVFGAIGSTIRGAFNGVVGFVRSVFNGIIDAVNGVIGGINGVGSVVGKALGVDIHVSKLPRLAKGGIVQARPGGVIANIGEGRYDEAVVPLTPQFKDALAGGAQASFPSQVTLVDSNGSLLGLMDVRVERARQSDRLAAGRGARGMV